MGRRKDTCRMAMRTMFPKAPNYEFIEEFIFYNDILNGGKFLLIRADEEIEFL